jgi:hypothetical protein
MKKQNFQFTLTSVIAINLSMGTSFAQQSSNSIFLGIPTSSPGVFWPRAESLESLGFGRLYPNGPEFGLGNTSGGFGLAGTGPLSGVGLTQRSVPSLEQAELDQPAITKRLVESLNEQRSNFQILNSQVLSNTFRFEIQRGSVGQALQTGPIVRSDDFISADRVLKDQPARTEDILKSGL